MRGQHHVAHDQAAVIDADRPVFVRKHNQDDRRTLGRVEALVPAAALAVRPGEFVAQHLVGDGDRDGCLFSSGVGGVETCLDNLLYLFLRGASPP